MVLKSTAHFRCRIREIEDQLKNDRLTKEGRKVLQNRLAENREFLQRAIDREAESEARTEHQ